MNNKAFLNILLSTALTLLIVSAFVFYIFSHPKESASSAFAIGEQAAHVIADNVKDSSAHIINATNKSSNSTPQNVPEKKETKEKISIIGRAILD